MVDTEVDRGNMEVENYPAAEVCCRLHINAATVKDRDCAIERVRRLPPTAIAHELEAFWPPLAWRLESGSMWLARAPADRGTVAIHRPAHQTMGSHADGPRAVSTASTGICAVVHNYDTG
jgi:hypothetical protein